MTRTVACTNQTRSICFTFHNTYQRASSPMPGILKSPTNMSIKTLSLTLLGSSKQIFQKWPFLFSMLYEPVQMFDVLRFRQAFIVQVSSFLTLAWTCGESRMFEFWGSNKIKHHGHLLSSTHDCAGTSTALAETP